MLKQQPTLDITLSNWYQVWAQVDKVKSHFIQSARENIAEIYNLHRIESTAERLGFIDSLLAENKYHFPIAESVEGGVRGPNQTQRESNAVNDKESVHFASSQKQSRRLSKSKFTIGRITAVSMMMDFIIP